MVKRTESMLMSPALHYAFGAVLPISFLIQISLEDDGDDDSQDEMREKRASCRTVNN